MAFTKPKAFVKQRENYDPTPCFIPVLSVPLRPCTAPLRDLPASSHAEEDVEVENLVPAQSKSTLRTTTSTVPACEDEVDMSTMFKEKRKKRNNHKDPDWFAQMQVPFAEYARRLLSNVEFISRIADGKRAASQAGLPLLRIALGWNSCNRIRAIAYGLYKATFPKQCNKATLIASFIQNVQACVKSIPQEIADVVADLGIVHTTDNGLTTGEIVYLRANATSSAGEACVAACETLVGWVVRGETFVEFSIISSHCVYYGKLVEKRKELTMYN